MPVYKAEAIVLRRTNLGEADRIVTLFCRDQGKVAAVAKGARRQQSRLSGRLELFSHVRVLLAVGRTLDVISQVEVVHTHSLLRGDLDRLGFAAFAVELTDRATADREPAPEIFESLCGALELMQAADPQLVALWLVARLLVHTGYAPVTDRCQVCGRTVRGAAAFSSALGGTLCEADRPRDPDAILVSSAALHMVRGLLHAPLPALGTLTPERRLRSEVGGLLQRYAEYRWETKLKSPGVIAEIARTAPTSGSAN
jgi:DNA repair protein RecO (recombination protein O)